jgi:hypothetical protein
VDTTLNNDDFLKEIDIAPEMHFYSLPAARTRSVYSILKLHVVMRFCGATCKKEVFMHTFMYLSVCLFFYVPLKNILLMGRRHHYWSICLTKTHNHY